jgi:hypothetical protein
MRTQDNFNRIDDSIYLIQYLVKSTNIQSYYCEEVIESSPHCTVQHSTVRTSLENSSFSDSSLQPSMVKLDSRGVKDILLTMKPCPLMLQDIRFSMQPIARLAPPIPTFLVNTIFGELHPAASISSINFRLSRTAQRWSTQHQI